MNKPTPKTYRTTNWSSYNRALINWGNISIWFDPNTQWYAQPQNKQGRNQTYSDTAIQCCLMINTQQVLYRPQYSGKFLLENNENGGKRFILSHLDDVIRFKFCNISISSLPKQCIYLINSKYK